jgi:hypothetical protein
MSCVRPNFANVPKGISLLLNCCAFIVPVGCFVCKCIELCVNMDGCGGVLCHNLGIVGL